MRHRLLTTQKRSAQKHPCLTSSGNGCRGGVGTTGPPGGIHPAQTLLNDRDAAAQHLSVLYPLTPPRSLGNPQFWIRVHQGQNSSPEEENSGPEDGRVKGGGTAAVVNSHATSVPQLGWRHQSGGDQTPLLRRDAVGRALRWVVSILSISGSAPSDGSVGSRC